MAPAGATEEQDATHTSRPRPLRTCRLPSRSAAVPKNTAQPEQLAPGEENKKKIKLNNDVTGQFEVDLSLWLGDHNDVCEKCDEGGNLLCCDFCNLVWHMLCVSPPLSRAPLDFETWICPACVQEVTSSRKAKLQKEMRVKQKAIRSGELRGIKADLAGGWRSILNQVRPPIDLGVFNSPEDAARAHDFKARCMLGDAATCNFPLDDSLDPELQWEGNGQFTFPTPIKGVCKSYEQWRAEMKWGNKKRHLGFFPTVYAAAAAYNQASAFYFGSDAAPPNNLDEVCLITNAHSQAKVDSSLLSDDDQVELPLPVRRPKDKLFMHQTLQLRTPDELNKLCAKMSVDERLIIERRKRSMVGKYNEPIIDDNHQVHRLPDARDTLEECSSVDVIMVNSWDPKAGNVREVADLLSSVAPAKLEKTLAATACSAYIVAKARKVLKRNQGLSFQCTSLDDVPDCDGVTKTDVRRATACFHKFGRDLQASSHALGWPKRRVVWYYYSIWKYTPGYQWWKRVRKPDTLASTTRLQKNALMDGNLGDESGPTALVSSHERRKGVKGFKNSAKRFDLLLEPQPLRFRGSRLRTLGTPTNAGGKK